jgi:hypothetical protein
MFVFLTPICWTPTKSTNFNNLLSHKNRNYPEKSESQCRTEPLRLPDDGESGAQRHKCQESGWNELV